MLENKLYNSLILIVMQLFGPIKNPKHNLHRHLAINFYVINKLYKSVANPRSIFAFHRIFSLVLVLLQE